jgi:glycine/D-amino acid oxidase-like deaminating enzyme/nitrite reductase/ring-hydroxylating ferredoxin subunit
VTSHGLTKPNPTERSPLRKVEGLVGCIGPWRFDSSQPHSSTGPVPQSAVPRPASPGRAGRNRGARGAVDAANRRRPHRAAGGDGCLGPDRGGHPASVSPLDPLQSSHRSPWIERAEAEAEPHPALEGDLEAEVAVVGAGITGMTTALLLAREGRSVIVVDQGRVGTGTTGHSTAKVTSQHGLTYARIRLTHGADGARAYAQANEAAKQRIVELAAEGIDCDLRRRDAWVYAESWWQRKLLERETASAREAGLPAELLEEAPLPFATRGGMRFTGQAELDPQRYVLGLAARFEQAGGRIFERTRATQVHEDGAGATVVTERGRIRASQVVLATLIPFLDRGLFFARAFGARSYAITARLSEAPGEAMLISAGSPMRSIRALPWQGGELLMVGGEGHDTGSSQAEPERYERLAEFAGRHWRVSSIEHRWSAQDFIPDDGVPYIGPLHLRSERVRVATGLKKWGITGGTVAAMLFADAIAGRTNDWSSLFSSTRIKPLAQAPKLLAENSRVGVHFLGDRLRERGGRPIEDLAPGEGAIVTAAGSKVAGYRDRSGNLHAVSSRCTHLYCQLRWNGAEESWDCPCHASRFSVDGEVLNGPAVRALEQRPIA